MYKIMMVISTLVRQFWLPNPFECFGDKALLINLISEPIIHSIAFSLVGLIYRKGSAPALGSILYLLAYSLITGVLLLMSIFEFAWWWVLIIVVALIAIIIGILYLKEKFL